MLRNAGETAIGDRAFDAGAVDESEFALIAQNVRKDFKIPHTRMRTLKQRVVSFRDHGYDVLHALDDVSVSVRTGEFLGIVGRNGSGKSTLLKCMAGIYVPDTGSIAVRGKLSTFIELGVGFSPEMTARENVVLNASLLGLSPSVARERFDEVIAFAELEDFVDLKLKNYSSGMHVRLAFAVAINVSADVLVIDEVLAVGDASFQQKCFDTFEQMRADGRTIVLVTHDMGMVERFCDRAIMLESGRVVSEGDPKQVARDYLQINFDRTKEIGGDRGEHSGDGAARIDECHVIDQLGDHCEKVRQGEWVTLEVPIRFVRDIEDPIVGVTVLNEHGTTVFQTNSLWDGLTKRSFTAGEEAVYRVRIKNYLEEGRYFISPAVTYASGVKVAEWFDHAASMFVVATHRTGAVANLPHETSLEPVTAANSIGSADGSDD